MDTSRRHGWALEMHFRALPTDPEDNHRSKSVITWTLPSAPAPQEGLVAQRNKQDPDQGRQTQQENKGQHLLPQTRHRTEFPTEALRRGGW